MTDDSNIAFASNVTPLREIGKPVLELLTLQDLSKALKISTHTIYYWISRNPDFPCHRIGRHLRFKLPDVIAYWDSRAKEASCHDLHSSVQLRTSNSSSLKTRNADRVYLNNGSKRKG